MEDQNENQEQTTIDSGQQQNQEPVTTQEDFSIPEEYKERGWTKVFNGKTGEELKKEFFRSYDSSQTLIGKKVEDYIKGTDLKSLDNYEEIKQALTEQIQPEMKAPEDAKGYEFNEILKDKDGNLSYEYPDEALDYFGDKFKEFNLSKEQGQGLLKAYTEFEINEFQQYTNADELDNDINEMFNNNSENRTQVETMLREFLPQEDQDFLQKTAPNHTIKMFYKLAKGLTDKYGYQETTTNAAKPSQIRMSEADKNAEYDRLVAQLEELDSRPQKVGERERILSQMKKIF